MSAKSENIALKLAIALDEFAQKNVGFLTSLSHFDYVIVVNESHNNKP